MSSSSRVPETRPSRERLRADAPETKDSLEDLESEERLEWAARPGRRTTRERLEAGLRGLKFAMRGDSSFFAHAYRGLFIILTASLLAIDPVAWCLLLQAAGLVIVSELAHSAVEALARAHPDPENPTLEVARDIATAAVLIAVVLMVALAVFIFTRKLGDLMSWW